MLRKYRSCLRIKPFDKSLNLIYLILICKISLAQNYYICKFNLINKELAQLNFLLLLLTSFSYCLDDFLNRF
jgi:hypothetical protein